jgi:hypothetical protein
VLCASATPESTVRKLERNLRAKFSNISGSGSFRTASRELTQY